MLKKEIWFEQLFNNSGVGILIVDKNRKILEANSALCDMFGYKYEELINQSAEFLHISEKSYLNFKNIAFDKVLQKQQPLNLEYKFQHKNSEVIWINISGDCISSTEEVIWIISDITTKKKLQNKLSDLNQTLSSKIEEQVDSLREKDRQLQYQSRQAQLGEMLNMISHQWRQPLMAISSTTGYLHGKILIDEFDKDTFIDELGSIEDSTEYLSNTMNDFRTFFSPNKEKVLTTLEKIVDSTLKIVEPILRNEHIKVELDYKCYKEIYSLENEIRHVVLTILKNSEDAFFDKTTLHKKIRISTYLENENVILKISDNAGGIKEEFLEKIFDSFFTTKSRKYSTGLGLCMSKTIIENNCKGKIFAKNSDEGASFFISLPLSK